MRTYLLVLCCCLVWTPVWADSLELLLNKVTLQLNAEQWVSTKTALVSIGINASVSDAGIEKIQNQVLEKLKRLSSKADWHLVSFDRTLDKSGLEHLQITAEARLENNELGGLRDKVKEISKPGETYTIDNLQFTPSEDENREANNNLRNTIYQQAKAELERLNKVYPEQKYYLHDINFLSNITSYPAAKMLYGSANDNLGAVARSAPLSVGDKLRIVATVVLATVPDPAFAKK